MKSQRYSRADLERFLSGLAEAGNRCLTIYVEPGLFPQYVLDVKAGPEWHMLLDEVKAVVQQEGVLRAAEKYGTGAAIFWGEGAAKHLIIPPFPLPQTWVSTGMPDVSLLKATLGKRYLLGVVLVAWGSYALGVFDGGRPVEWKTGTGYIHKKHRKGGRSERRFARRTEEQKKDFLRKVANRIDERFGGLTLDYIYFGGNRLILKPLVRECRYLQSNAAKLSSRVLETRYADKEALFNSYREITTSLLFSFDSVS
jgi:hypothetical protein